VGDRQRKINAIDAAGAENEKENPVGVGRGKRVADENAGRTPDRFAESGLFSVYGNMRG